MKSASYIEWNNLKNIPFFLCQVVEDEENKDIDIYYLGERVLQVVFQKVCLGRRLQILQICKYSDSWFRTTRRGVLFFFLCYSLHSGNKSRSRSIRGTGLR